MTTSVAPILPAGRYVDLPGRGRTFIREVRGPANAPTVMLLHGWTGSADLTWCATYEDLGTRYHVIAPDHRGHGRGIKNGRRASLAECADDVAALAKALDVETFIAVGHSMGGAIAQLVCQRHPELVDGLVLCASATRFEVSRHDRTLFRLLRAAAPLTRHASCTVQQRVARTVLGTVSTRSTLRSWALSELDRHDWPTVVSLGLDLRRFSAWDWVGTIGAPISQVITLNDSVVETRRQLELAAKLGTSKVHLCEGDHGAPLNSPTTFVPALLRAVADVVGAHEAQPTCTPLETYPFMAPQGRPLTPGALLPTG